MPKPTDFVTGLVIQVPESREVGESVKINSEDNPVTSRA